MMKNTIFTIGILAFISCSETTTLEEISLYNQCGDINHELTIDQQEKDFLISKYIHYNNSQYFLDLSQDKALNLGISQKDYSAILSLIDEVNAQIPISTNAAQSEDDRFAIYHATDLQSMLLFMGKQNKPYGCWEIPDVTGINISFKGYYRLESRVGCTSPLWTVMLEGNFVENNGKYSYTGTMFNVIIKSMTASQSTGNETNWHFHATKGAGNNCRAFISFHSKE